MRRLTSFPTFRAALASIQAVILSLLVLPAIVHGAEKPGAHPSPQITQAIDEGHLVKLSGNVYPAATAEADQGVADNNLALQRMILVLKRSGEQQAALQKFLNGQKDPKSADYRHWLTPEQFGARFGASAADIAKISQWLRSHGFSIDSVAKGGNAIVFSGTNAQLRSAFHTEMHRYNVRGVMHVANAADPQVPAALAPVVAGIAKLNDFRSQPMHATFGVVKRARDTGKWRPAVPNPQFNTNISGSDYFAVGPSDFATIYNVKPLWDANIDGTGQTIAIVGRSDIKAADVDAFRSYFGLPAKKLNIIYNGPNPGYQYGDEGESDLDVEWSGAVAKNATIDFVVSASTATSDGVELSALYVIDNNLAPVMSMSYGECELGLGNAGNQFINQMWEQAAAQGITVMVSTGDAGSAACDQGNITAQYGLAVNGLASTPYNVAVGGTDLYGTYLDTPTYWNSENDPTTRQSAKSYMPELPWNNTCGNPQLLAAYQAIGLPDATLEDFCNDFNLGVDLQSPVGGGGGPSNCTDSSNGDPTTCSGGYQKPAWQSGVPGIPADSVRDIPDVSLFAGSGLWGSFYVFCGSDMTPSGSCDFNSGDDVQALAAGGTSFASPAFAGIMALVNQKTNSIQGNANYDLYKLAATQFGGGGAPACDSSVAATGNACMFYDLSQGSNATDCANGSVNCTPNDPNHFFGVLPGWTANSGYDTAVGLGTVNAYNLVNGWSTGTASYAPTQTTLTLDAATLAYGTPFTGMIAVAAAGDGTPTGDTSLITLPGTSGVGFGPFVLNRGNASITGNGVPAGTYSVVAHYAGDATFAPSNSDAATLTISKGTTTSALTASRSDIHAGESVTFDVAIATTSSASSPTGTVTFTNTTTGAALGSAGVVAGTDNNGYATGRAALTIAGKALNQGDNSVAASYSGDGNYVAATATPVSVTYTPPFSLSSAQPSLTVQSGNSATTTLTITTNGGTLPATVVLACAPPVPAGLSCAFNPATLPAGSATSTATLAVNAAFPSGSATHKRATPSHRAKASLLGAGGAVTFASLALLLFPIRRRSLRVFSCIGLLMLGMVLIACGNDSHPPAATTTTVSADPASGPQGTTFNFTANVGSTQPGTPTGTVTFSDGSTVLGSAQVSDGHAKISTSTLSYGSHAVVAIYSGDPHYLSSASTSPAVADVQYQTTLNISASDSLGNTTTIQVPVAVQ